MHKTGALIPLLCSLAIQSIVAHAHDHRAHVHGVAKLEVAVEGAHIDLHLESPLEALLGFERAPRTDKERAAVARMRQALEQADKLFIPTAAAGCRLASVRVETPRDTLNKSAFDEKR